MEEFIHNENKGRFYEELCLWKSVCAVQGNIKSLECRMCLCVCEYLCVSGVLGRVGLGGTGELICDWWLLHGVWAPVYKLEKLLGRLKLMLLKDDETRKNDKIVAAVFLRIPFCSEVLHGLGKDVGTCVVTPPLSISIGIGPTDQMSCLSSKLRALVPMPRWMKNSSANNNSSGDSNIRKLTADELFMRNLIKHLHSRLQGKDGALAWSDIINLELVVSARTCLAAGITEDQSSLEEDLGNLKDHERITLALTSNPTQLIHLRA